MRTQQAEVLKAVPGANHSQHSNIHVAAFRLECSPEGEEATTMLSFEQCFRELCCSRRPASTADDMVPAQRLLQEPPHKILLSSTVLPLQNMSETKPQVFQRSPAPTACPINSAGRLEKFMTTGCHTDFKRG